MNVKETYEKFLHDYDDATVAAILTLASSILQPVKIDDSVATVIQRGIRQGFFGLDLGNQQNFTNSFTRNERQAKGNGYDSEHK